MLISEQNVGDTVDPSSSRPARLQHRQRAPTVALRIHAQSYNLRALRGRGGSAEWSMHDAAQKSPMNGWHVYRTRCLDSLRSKIMYRADDTPRWASKDKEGEIGVGQYPMCRGWSRLESWARENTAYYRYLDREADYIDQR